jgi:hypothetical protein
LAGQGAMVNLPAGVRRSQPRSSSPLELGAHVLHLAACQVEASPLGGLHAGHRPAGLGRDGVHRLQQRLVVIWQVARIGCLAARGYQQPETSLPGRAGIGRLVIGGGLGYQLGDDLAGYHQPVQLVLGIGELLAQHLDLTGQLGHAAGDPFRQLHPALQRYLPIRLDTPNRPERVK